MYEILRLIRIRTIAFAALTMYAMRYLVIRPMLDINGLALQMTGVGVFSARCCRMLSDIGGLCDQRLFRYQKRSDFRN